MLKTFKNQQQRIEELIACPPKSGVELNDAISLHTRLALGLRFLIVTTDLKPEEVEEELFLLKKLWEVIEIGLQTQFAEEDEEDDDGNDWIPFPDVPRFFVNGNATLH